MNNGTHPAAAPVRRPFADVPEVETPAAPAARAESGAPLIILPSGSLGILECARKLFPLLAKGRRLYTRGGCAVELTPAGALAVVRPAGFRSRIEESGAVVQWRQLNGEAVLKPTTCPEDMARALLESVPASELLPPIATVTGCPVAIEGADGRLRVLGRGYHSERGGVLVTGGKAPAAVPLTEAVAALAGLLEEFSFQTPSDRSRALAAFLAPALVIGGSLDGRVPADVAEADQSQSGKGYRHKLIAAVYGEKPYIVAQRNGGVGGLDESFSQALIGGRPFIQFDNLRGGLDSQFLESFLTEDTAAARVPHRGEVPVDPRRFCILVSSNGVETTRDLANRSSIVRIRKRAAGHRWREYPEGDLLAHVRARQGYFLACVFAVLGEWLERGKPRTKGETRHDFRAWAQTLDWMVQNLCGAAPLLDGHLAAQERVSNPALNFLRALCLAADRDGRLSEPWTASNFAELAEEHGIEVPGLRGGDDQRARKQVGITLGRIFREQPAAEVDGFTVRRSERSETRLGGGGDYPVKNYEITRG